ncbi:M48 family metallopeptidase [Oscillospiraceae bacterium PP1C4]
MVRKAAGIEYELIYKKVKNLNLRIATGGAVHVSASKRVPLHEIDEFVASRANWIMAARERVMQREALAQLPDSYTDAECLAAFAAVSDRIYPLFADLIPGKPKLCVRWMKSRWGVCHIRGHYITLNKQLMNKPLAALEYVVLHEYVHFLHPNHQAGFHAEMTRLMPDYKLRRALLK